MKKIALALLSVFFSLAPTVHADVPAQAPAKPAEAVWGTDFDAAARQAKADGKRILLDFTGSDWCVWCMRMDGETFSQQAFKDYAAQHLVLVTVDFPAHKALSEAEARQNQMLQERFGVNGFPSFVVLSPAGEEVDRQSGYLEGGPEAFITFLRATENAETPAKPHAPATGTGSKPATDK